MTERRGWCPSLFDPMPSGDGLLVRVKPPRGMLSARAAAALAEAASQYGNGTIELTRRGNLQIRGLSPESVAPFAAEMIGCGLASADAEFERRRTVMVSPLIGDDPSLADIGAIAGEIERALIGERRFGDLPEKFGILVDGGGVLPMGGVPADISVRAEDKGFTVTFDGDSLAARCGPNEGASAVIALAQAFLDLSAPFSVAPPRMRRLVQVMGADALFGAAGLRPTARIPDPPAQNPVGFLRYRGADCGACGVGVPFGHLISDTLSTLAELAARFGDNMLRLTPWRAVMIGGVAESDTPQLLASAANAGLIVDPADPRRAVIACPGRPSCSSASVPTRADAAFLASCGAVPGGIVHVSGCSKGCAHSGAADITLVGDKGRYGLVRNGAAGDAPRVTGLTMAEAVALLEREMAA